jgi:phospholipid/cholesterol/gamma-HCH transport system substrate-binding protein
MQKTSPTVVQLSVIAAFALSCMGLLIYLWITFGGPIPLKPESYEVTVPLTEATQLAEQSDVRISGISVGKVKTIDLGADGASAAARIEIDAEYAPLPSDTRAILRTKTLLGETYVELTPGTGEAETLPEGASLPRAQVAESVQLDEIFRTFDPKTRQAWRTWMQEGAVAIGGRGDDVSYALAEFEPFFHGFDRVFRVLDTQRNAVEQLFANGTTTFDALNRRRGELQGLITDGDRLFRTLGERNEQIEETFRAFPTFLDESRAVVERLHTFARDTDPLARQLTPAFAELSPTLEEVERMAPHFRGFFTGLPPVEKAAPRGFGALRTMLRDDFPPLLVALDPFLRSLNPVLMDIAMHRREIAALFANGTAATNASRPGEPKFLRSLVSVHPEGLAVLPRRLRSNRANAYVAPGAFARIGELAGFETRQCATGITALLDPSVVADPAFSARAGGDPGEAQTFFEQLQRFSLGGELNTNNVPAPGCAKQAPFDPIGAPGPATDYPHVVRQAP